MNAFNKYVKGVLTEMNEDANVLTRPDHSCPKFQQKENITRYSLRQFQLR